MYNLDVEIKELDITSSWNSILKLKPNFKLTSERYNFKNKIQDLAKNNLF